MVGEEENGNGSKYPSWKWLVGVLFFVVAFLVTQGMASLKADNDRKLDRDVYIADCKARELKFDLFIKDIEAIRADTKLIKNLHLPPHLREK